MSNIKYSLNSIPSSVFEVRANSDGTTNERADILNEGRVLTYEQFRRGKMAMNKLSGLPEDGGIEKLSGKEYSDLNKMFQRESLLYCAKKACERDGTTAPETYEDFVRQGQRWYKNDSFMKVLQGIWQEVLQPILPAVYSEAVSMFADVVEVGFGQTQAITIGSNDIPIFQDSAWGAARSVPANRFYPKTYTLNPQPRTAEIRAKWMQLIGNGMDFGVFFANIVAGLYAKTMGLWNAAMTAAAGNPALVPTSLSYNFNSENWITLANQLAAVNNTTIDNIIAYGSPVPLAKVLPYQATGSSNVNMDAALAMMLGADWVRNAQFGEYMKVRLMALRDTVVPGTQNTSVTTVLDPHTIWLMAANGRKPLTIGYNSATPITIEIEPERTASFEFIVNMTTAIDSVAIFSSKVGIITI